MRRRNRGLTGMPEIMIIPMIDIIFFLLVFFMYSSLYANTEQQLALSLPKATSVTAKTIDPISITCKKNGQLFIDKKPIKQDELRDEIQKYIAEEPAQAFVVRADKDVVYDRVITILDDLKLNGAKYVSVATDRK